VDVWKRMTIEQVAISAKKDVRNIIEAISLSDPTRRYNKTTVIEDQDVLHNAIRKLGAKFRIISQPDSKESKKETKNHDVTKRYE